MTVEQIIADLRDYKPITRRTLYKHLRALKIKPIGVRQKPQQYPDDVPKKILKRLGIPQTDKIRDRLK